MKGLHNSQMPPSLYREECCEGSLTGTTEVIICPLPSGADQLFQKLRDVKDVWASVGYSPLLPPRQEVEFKTLNSAF